MLVGPQISAAAVSALVRAPARFPVPTEGAHTVSSVPQGLIYSTSREPGHLAPVALPQSLYLLPSRMQPAGNLTVSRSQLGNPGQGKQTALLSPQAHWEPLTGGREICITGIIYSRTAP